MFDHIGLQSSQARSSMAFYESVLSTLAFVKMFDYESGAAFGDGKVASFFIDQVESAEATSNVHVAFTAGDQAQVEAFYRVAIEAGAKGHFAPGFIPEYGPDYFAAFVYDLDGNKIEAVCHVRPG